MRPSAERLSATQTFSFVVFTLPGIAGCDDSPSVDPQPAASAEDSRCGPNGWLHIGVGVEPHCHCDEGFVAENDTCIPYEDSSYASSDPESDAMARAVYRSGHGDLAIKLQQADGDWQWSTALRADEMDFGDEVRAATMPLSQVLIVADTTFDLDGVDGSTNHDALQTALCMTSGQPMYWLPQTVTGGDEPFLGFEVTVETSDDATPIELELLSVVPPRGTNGEYVIWQDGFTLETLVSTCEDISTFPLSPGHHHVNQGFVGTPGLWTVTFNAHAETDEGVEETHRFTVNLAVGLSPSEAKAAWLEE